MTDYIDENDIADSEDPAELERAERIASAAQLEPCSGCGQIQVVSINGLCPNCKNG